MAKTCGQAIGCKINDCIGAQKTNCDGSNVAGSSELKIAALHAISEYVYQTDAAGTEFITDIIMNNPDLDPTNINGCPEHLFYNICVTEDTLGVNIVGNPNDTQSSYTYTVNVTGNFEGTVTCEIAQKIQRLALKEVVLMFKPNNGDDYHILGIGGGLYLGTTTFEYGVAKTDAKFTTISFAGEAEQAFNCIWRGDAAATEELIESITFDCENAAIDPCQ